MHELLELALKRIQEKEKEHDSPCVAFEDYCVFGDVSAADFIHREATRVCAMAERGDFRGMKEHLVDVVVFAMLMWGELPKVWEEEVYGDCPYFCQQREEGSVDIKTFCLLTQYPIQAMWWSMCRGIGKFKWNRCSTYLLNEAKKGEMGE